MEKPESPEKILLVEGNDDQHVVEHIWHSHSHENPLPFHIKNTQGIDNLLSSLPVQLKNMYLQSLGILVDANDDPIQRWNKIIRCIGSNTAMDIQTIPDSDGNGTILDSDTIKIGIWLMPDNESSGEIEEFILQLIPEGDPIWPRAQQFIDDIPSDLRKFKDSKELRAKIHAWLATCKNPHRMGTAIRTRDLNSSAPLAMRLFQWLNSLFSDPL